LEEVLVEQDLRVVPYKDEAGNLSGIYSFQHNIGHHPWRDHTAGLAFLAEYTVRQAYLVLHICNFWQKYIEGLGKVLLEILHHPQQCFHFENQK